MSLERRFVTSVDIVPCSFIYCIIEDKIRGYTSARGFFQDLSGFKNYCEMFVDEISIYLGLFVLFSCCLGPGCIVSCSDSLPNKTFRTCHKVSND